MSLFMPQERQNDAGCCWNQMIMSDSTAEADAKAALSKLKRKEQVGAF
jgi:hypothetical protein